MTAVNAGAVKHQFRFAHSENHWSSQQTMVQLVKEVSHFIHFCQRARSFLSNYVTHIDMILLFVFVLGLRTLLQSYAFQTWKS